MSAEIEESDISPPSLFELAQGKKSKQTLAKEQQGAENLPNEVEEKQQTPPEGARITKKEAEKNLKQAEANLPAMPEIAEKPQEKTEEFSAMAEQPPCQKKLKSFPKWPNSPACKKKLKNFQQWPNSRH